MAPLKVTEISLPPRSMASSWSGWWRSPMNCARKDILMDGFEEEGEDGELEMVEILVETVVGMEGAAHVDDEF